MAASENRSSPRVAPRSVTRAMAISSMIFVDGVGLGLDAAGQGQVADGAEADGALLDGLAACGSGLNSLSVSSMPSRSKTRRWWEK